jgi:ketosteroid isomerase-like protein
MQRGLLMTMRRASVALVLMLLVAGATWVRADKAPPTATLQDELRATETAFAKTMADRDHAAFATFIADEAVFFGRNELRGKPAIVAAWKSLYEGKEAPFSWRPETVSVLDSGTLGLSSGPVFGPDGKQTGTFSSIWRRTAGGKWEIIFDKGCPYCADK